MHNRVHHVNSSIVLKQNAYLLYYKKMPLSTQPRAKSAPNNNSHKPQTPLSSSTELKEQSRAGSAPLFLHKLTPTYQVFYKEEDDVIKFITIKVELPTDDVCCVITLWIIIIAENLFENRIHLQFLWN